MVGDTPPHDSDDERDDLAALDFSVAKSEQAESDLDALGDYAEEPTEDDELPVPVFAVTNPPGTVTVTAFLDGRVRQPNDRYARQAVGVIHLHFNDDTFEANDSTGVNTRKHAGSLDEAD